MGHSDRHQFFSAMWDLVDKHLDADSAEWLRTQLSEDAEARRMYVAFLDLTASLRWRQSLNQQEAALARIEMLGMTPANTAAQECVSVPPVEPPSIPEQSRKVSSSHPPTVPPSHRPSPILGFLGRKTATFGHPVFWATLAAGVLFAGYVVTISWNMLGRQLASSADSPHHPTVPPSHHSDTVATIRDESAAQWSPNSRLTDSSTSRSAPITAGQPLSIQSGLVELELKQGTTLLIEGPADWQITGENSATLTHGKLVAKVPQQATGFTLKTPTAKIIDLGTEFGVEVAQTGESEIVVLKGLVNVKVRDSGPARNTIVLRAGQSVRIGGDGSPSPVGPALSDKFTRLTSRASVPAPTNTGYEVLFHYRLGENDPNAKAGEVAADQIVGTGVLGAKSPLLRVGSPKYIADTACADSTLALSLTGPELSGYVSKELESAPVDNIVLEAWVRATSARKQAVTYLGDPGANGYGLVLYQEKWTALLGGLKFISAEQKATLNAWTHLAWLRERGQGVLFVNGKWAASEMVKAPRTPGPQLSIGNTGDVSAQGSDAVIDEVRLIRLKALFRPNMLLWQGSGPKPGADP